MGNPTQRALLFLRLSIFTVMLMWTLDKFVNPGHAIAVFNKFYHLGGLNSVAIGTIAALELVLITAFVLGYRKTFSYGAVLALHAVSTLSSYHQYLNPWPNLLFFAAIPMLAACWALFSLRSQDTLFTVRG